jgi:Glycosyl hydrolase family 26
MNSLWGQVFATMFRMAAPGKHGHPAKKSGAFAKWRLLLTLTMVLAGAVGFLTYSYFPGTSAKPVADLLGPGTFPDQISASVLGQGNADSSSPAPIVTATAKAPVPERKPRHSPRPVAPVTSPPASPAATAPPAPAGASFTDAGGMGIYDGKFSPDGIETAASWLGSSTSIKYAMDFIDATDFSHISNPWQLSNWKGSPYTMVWGVPMVPCGAPATQCATNVSDFDEVANGGADSDYKTLAQNLVAAGFGSSYIRLGWEFNAEWMGWAICNQDRSGLTSWANDFVPAFQNIVTSMRSVSGANFKFIWNPDESSNVSCPGASLEKFYPGDSYVDEVALDTYDGIGEATGSDAARWTDLLNGVSASGSTAVTPDPINGQQFPGYGMNWLAAFGKEHNKEVGLPEWGLEATDQNGGGGDDAYFMTQMGNWLKANGTGPSIFWNVGGGTLQLNIPNYTSDDTPDATTAFRTEFSR